MAVSVGSSAGGASAGSKDDYLERERKYKEKEGEEPEVEHVEHGHMPECMSKSNYAVSRIRYSLQVGRKVCHQRNRHVGFRPRQTSISLFHASPGRSRISRSETIRAASTGRHS